METELEIKSGLISKPSLHLFNEAFTVARVCVSFIHLVNMYKSLMPYISLMQHSSYLPPRDAAPQSRPHFWHHSSRVCPFLMRLSTPPHPTLCPPSQAPTPGSLLILDNSLNSCLAAAPLTNLHSAIIFFSLLFLFVFLFFYLSFCFFIFLFYLRS